MLNWRRLYGITATYYRNEEIYRQDPEKPENISQRKKEGFAARKKHKRNEVKRKSTYLLFRLFRSAFWFNSILRIL